MGPEGLAVRSKLESYLWPPKARKGGLCRDSAEDGGLGPMYGGSCLPVGTSWSPELGGGLQRLEVEHAALEGGGEQSSHIVGGATAMEGLGDEGSLAPASRSRESRKVDAAWAPFPL